MSLPLLPQLICLLKNDGLLFAIAVKGPGGSVHIKLLLALAQVLPLLGEHLETLLGGNRGVGVVLGEIEGVGALGTLGDAVIFEFADALVGPVVEGGASEVGEVDDFNGMALDPFLDLLLDLLFVGVGLGLVLLEKIVLVVEE